MTGPPTEVGNRKWRRILFCRKCDCCESISSRKGTRTLLGVRKFHKLALVFYVIFVYAWGDD